MYRQILLQMRANARTGRLLYPEHMQEAMDDDDLLAVDIENCILIGEIIERQWDNYWDEWKYVVQGESLDGDEIVVVAKPGYNDRTVLITTFRL